MVTFSPDYLYMQEITCVYIFLGISGIATECATCAGCTRIYLISFRSISKRTAWNHDYI